jgi:hypothetical protein
MDRTIIVPRSRQRGEAGLPGAQRPMDEELKRDARSVIDKIVHLRDSL